MTRTNAWILGHNDDDPYVLFWADGWDCAEHAARVVAKQAMDRYLAELADTGEFSAEETVYVLSPDGDEFFAFEVTAELRASVVGVVLAEQSDDDDDEEDD